jgi:hypothetical protein
VHCSQFCKQYTVHSTLSKWSRGSYRFVQLINLNFNQGIKIINVLGNIVLELVACISNPIIDISMISPGIYYILTDDRSCATFIKE